MKFKIKNFEIEISIIILSVFLISIFSKESYVFFEKYFMCFLFIAFHESMHLFVASVFGRYPYKLKISVVGLNLEYIKNYYEKPLNNIKWLLIYLSGPISNLILAIVFYNFEFVKNINIIIALTNLMPIFPLDGYNILKNILILQKNKYFETIIDIISKILLILISIFAIIVFMVTKNPSMLIFTITIILIKIIEEKSANAYI